MQTTLVVDEGLDIEEFRARYSFPKRELDMQSVLVGTIKGVIRRVSKAGIVMRRATRTVKVVEREHNARNVALVVEPGYAPGFLESMDEGVIKARRYISTAFNDPTQNLLNVDETCKIGRALIEGASHTVRSRPSGIRKARFQKSRKSDRGSRSNRGRVERDAQAETEVNYAPWWRVQGNNVTSERTIARVVRFACSKAPAFGDDKLEPHIWPKIPKLAFATNMVFGPEEDQRDAWSFRAEDIYSVARMWSFRYGSPETFDELVQ
eukprot:8834804-Pyramimonas_sp.AAC.1